MRKINPFHLAWLALVAAVTVWNSSCGPTVEPPVGAPEAKLNTLAVRTFNLAAAGDTAAAICQVVNVDEQRRALICRTLDGLAVSVYRK